MCLKKVIINWLRVYWSLEICRSSAFVDKEVSQQKQAMLNINTIIVPPIKLGAISWWPKKEENNVHKFRIKDIPARKSEYFTNTILFRITINSWFKICCLNWRIWGASICEETFRIKPARLVYLKFKATMASGIAGNNVPTAAIVILLSNKYFQLEFDNSKQFMTAPAPTDGGGARGTHWVYELCEDLTWRKQTREQEISSLHDVVKRYNCIYTVH